MEVITQVAPAVDLADLSELLAQRLVFFRKSRRLTRADLASLMPGISVHQIEKTESQSGLVKGVSLIRVCRLLDVSLSDFPPGAYDYKSVLQARRKANLAGQRPTPVIDLVALIEALRYQQGLSYAELASLWSIPSTTLKNWVSGLMPGKNYISLVSSKLGLPASAIATV